MLEWLKRITKYEPRPIKIVDIEADLKSVDSSRMYGEIEYEVYEDGNWKLEIEIEHAGRRPEGPFDIRINNCSIVSFDAAPNKYDTEITFTSKAGHSPLKVTPGIGMSVEVYTPLGHLMTGVFENKLGRSALQVRKISAAS